MGDTILHERSFYLAWGTHNFMTRDQNVSQECHFSLNNNEREVVIQ